MILKLLTLRRLCSEKRSAAKYQVGAFIVSGFVYKKVLLFRADRGVYHFYARIGVKKPEYSHSLFVERLH